MENHHFLMGKINYFYGHFPVRKLFVCQRVILQFFHDGFMYDVYNTTKKCPKDAAEPGAGSFATVSSCQQLLRNWRPKSVRMERELLSETLKTYLAF